MFSTSWKPHCHALPSKLVASCIIALLTAALLLAQATPCDKKQKSDDSLTTKIRIVITAGEKDHPIAGASVYVRFTEPKLLHKDKLVEMNLKTSLEGIVKVPEIPRGKTEIQVIAPGWKTYGKWYDLQKDEETINIHLDRPTKWY
jgi:hypothetical protein